MLTLRITVPLAMQGRHMNIKTSYVNKLLLLMLLVSATTLRAQKVDSIFFHLYTDSLKKGTHNYINVDGKLSDGRWMPMTAKEIKFSASACEFSGNELIVPADFSGEKITVRAELKNNPSQRLETTIWIKKLPNPDRLPSMDDVLRDPAGKKKKRRGG